MGRGWAQVGRGGTKLEKSEWGSVSGVGIRLVFEGGKD